MFWQRSRQLLSGAAALAALAVLTLVLIALFSNMGRPATGGPTPTPEGPRLELEGFRTESSFGTFGGRQVPVKVSAPLPQAPDRVPVYKVESALGEPTPELLREWAGRLGLGPVRIYQDNSGDYRWPGSGTGYIALAEDGRVLRLSPDGGLTYQSALDSAWMVYGASGRPAPDPATAQAAAEDFLRRIPDLVVVEGSQAQVAFRAQPSPHMKSPETPVLSFEVVPLIDGIPLANQSREDMVTVGPDGAILSAYVSPLRVTPTGETVSVRPAEEVVRRFLAGDATIMRGSSGSMSPSGASTQMPQTFHRRPAFDIGDGVKTFGKIQHWAALDGGPDLYTLSGPQTFVLEGDVQATADLVEVEGLITGQAASGLWRIQVTAIRPIDSTKSWVSGQSGTVRRQGETVLLEAEDGQVYQLPDAPSDLPDGVRVMASGVVIDEGVAQARLEWQTITVAPQPSEVPPGPPPAAALPSAPVVVEKAVVVPATPAPAEPSRPITHVVQAGDTLQSIAQQYGVEVEALWQANSFTEPATLQPGQELVIPTPLPPTPAPTIVPPAVGVAEIRSIAGPMSVTLPSWWTYKPGDEVTLEGVLTANGFRGTTTEGEQKVWIDAGLLVGDEFNYSDQVMLQLTGDAITETMVSLDGLAVRVQGRLTGPEQGDQNATGGLTPQTLDVRALEPVNPDETRAVYAGPLRMETLEGRQVAVLSDTLSGGEFVLGDSLQGRWFAEGAAESDQQMAVIGVVVSGKTVAGRPVLRMRGMQPGRDIEPLVESLRARLDNTIQEVGPLDFGPEDVIIDRIELVLSFQVPPIRPSMPTGQPVPEITLPPAEPLYRLFGRSSDGQYTVTYDLVARP